MPLIFDVIAQLRDAVRELEQDLNMVRVSYYAHLQACMAAGHAPQVVSRETEESHGTEWLTDTLPGL